MDDLYALPNKHRDNSAKVYEVGSDEEERDEQCDRKSIDDSIEEKDSNKDLPYGWEKHEDNDGPYYWHIKSGTIQREPPLWPKNPQDVKELKTPVAQAPSSITQITTNKGSNALFQQHQSQQQIQSAKNEIVNNRIQVSRSNVPEANIDTFQMKFIFQQKETQGVSVTRSNTSSALDQPDEDRRRKEDLVLK